MLKFKRPLSTTPVSSETTPAPGDGATKAQGVAAGVSAERVLDAAHDYFDLDGLLTPEERALRHRVRAFVDAEIVPFIGEFWERDETPLHLFKKLTSLEIGGGTIQGYGCPGLSPLIAGVLQYELTRGDGSLATMFGVTTGLAMQSIYQLGSEEQRQRWLPSMATLDVIGAFGLTEPNIGSDAAHITTTARRDGDGYVLNGAKRWIGGATFADIVIIYAQDDQTGQIGAFVVEKGTPGFEATRIEHKLALRALPNADIVLTDCRVPLANKLERCRSFKDVARVLATTRAGVAWSAIGHAQAAYEFALAYAKGRVQFGRPIAGFQLIQAKLVEMLAELEAMKLLAWRLSTLGAAGKMSDGQAALVKMFNASKARRVVALARETMGGNGILIDRHVARHFADMEAVYSYEGTHEINTLVVGREITGMQAFV